MDRAVCRVISERKNGRRAAQKSPLYGVPRRRDRKSSAVPPFLAGLSGSLTQLTLRSSDIAEMRRAPRAGLQGRFHPPIREAFSIRQTASSFSVQTALMYYSSSTSRSSAKPKSYVYLTRISQICQPDFYTSSLYHNHLTTYSQ